MKGFVHHNIMKSTRQVMVMSVLEIVINNGMYITAIFTLNTVNIIMNPLNDAEKNYLKKYVSCGTTGKGHSLRLVKRLLQKAFFRFKS